MVQPPQFIWVQLLLLLQELTIRTKPELRLLINRIWQPQLPLEPLILAVSLGLTHNNGFSGAQDIGAKIREQLQLGETQG